MKEGVLLISMPFADASFPSLALSQLKAILREKAGICCDLLYLNMAFRNFTGRPEIYDRVNAYTLFGEWPFGEDLFGADWAESDRGGISFMERIRPLGMENPEPARSDLRFMRSCAGPFLDKWMAAIPWDRYGVIGFTSVYFQQVASLALARRIKKAYPEKIIAFGGANCNEATDKALLKLFPFIDWIFCGQADCSFPKAVLSWCKHPSNIPEKIQGVSYRDHGAVMTQGSGESESLDRLPVPDFEDFKAGLETWAPDIQTPMIPIELSRGCWWGRRSQCIFCGVNHNMLFFRSKSPERALDEIRTVVGRYGIQKIYITDSILKTGYFKTLLPVLAEEEMLQELFVETKANLTRRQVRVLKSAGVRRFQPGIESLDTELLTYMRKGTTLLKNVQLLKWSREYNVQPIWNLLYGFPGENRDAYHRMASIIPMLFHLHPPGHVVPVKLQRFSVLFNESAKWGIRDAVAAKPYFHIYPFKQEDLNRIAYHFHCEFDGKADIPAYTESLRAQMLQWQNAWKGPEPPLLAFKREGRGKSRQCITVYDSRSCAPAPEMPLDEETSAIYLSCDRQRSFEFLAEFLQKNMGKNYPGRTSLKKSLDKLVEKRLMLRENDLYLSLANDMEILGKNGGSMLACLFLDGKG